MILFILRCPPNTYLGHSLTSLKHQCFFSLGKTTVQTLWIGSHLVIEREFDIIWNCLYV